MRNKKQDNKVSCNFVILINENKRLQLHKTVINFINVEKIVGKLFPNGENG